MLKTRLEMTKKFLNITEEEIKATDKTELDKLFSLLWTREDLKKAITELEKVNDKQIDDKQSK